MPDLKDMMRLLQKYSGGATEEGKELFNMMGSIAQEEDIKDVTANSVTSS